MERDLEKLLENSQGALGLAYALDHDWLSTAQKNSARDVYNDIESSLSREILSRYFEKKIISLRLKLSELWHFKAVRIFMAKMVKSN